MKYTYLFVLIIYLVFICVHRLSIDGSVLGYRLFTINNNEMSPKYNFNDIIVVKDYDPSKLKVGDNISYKVMGYEYDTYYSAGEVLLDVRVW